MLNRPLFALVAGLCLAGMPTIAAAHEASAAAHQAPAAARSVSLADIEDRFSADGFRIVEIERYADVIEVKGYDRSGLCVEIYLDRHSGETLRRERDDSCGRRRGTHHRGFDDHHRGRGGDDHHGRGRGGDRHRGGHD
jgi:Peptidase propeptide and YPEB domain